MGVGGHIVVKTKITDDKGAAFRGVVVLKEIRKLFHKERVLECLFFSGSEEDGRDRRCAAVSVEVRRESVRMKNVES